MAAITPNHRNGKVTSYRFRACVGRGRDGKQIFRTHTWQIPQGVPPSKAERAAHAAADQWEKEVRAEHEKDLANPDRIKRREISLTETPFKQFVLEVWFPICIDNGENRPKTVSYYNDSTKNIVVYFDGWVLQDITSADIQKFLIFLRTEKGFSDQTVHHH